eukprot:9955722-Ditylum_brightwellii.AAC.1
MNLERDSVLGELGLCWYKWRGLRSIFRVLLQLQRSIYSSFDSWTDLSAVGLDGSPDTAFLQLV